MAKSEKYEPFCVFKLLFWRQKWVTGALHGNSLVVRRVSPGRILHVLVLFRTKYAVPRQIKPRILKLTASRGQRNLRAVFIFVNRQEKGCYRIVLLGLQNFDCRSYCGLSRRMQGTICINLPSQVYIVPEQTANLVPRVLSLPRESTLVAAGHVSMYTNEIPIRGGSLT